MKNIKVSTELEALEFCKENYCRIEFIQENYERNAHVVVTLGLVAKSGGKDLVEAVNRIVDMYFTPEVEYEKLPWWEDQKKYYIY